MPHEQRHSSTSGATTYAARPRRRSAATLVPRPHQREGLDALSKILHEHPRAQLVAACGTGKTLVGRWLAERLDSTLTAVMVPSLVLAAQAVREWRSLSGWRFEALIICSDPGTAAGLAERTSGDGSDVAQQFWAHQRARVTTDAARVAHVLSARTPTSPPLVIFSTYHSAPVLAEAVRTSRATLDLVVADEAHNLAGHPRAAFRTVLTDTQLPSARRVFMTATPVVDIEDPRTADDLSQPSLSMKDEQIFGPVAYRLDFAAAIERRLLVNYRVLVFETPEEHQLPELELDPGAALRAAAEQGLTSVLSFHGRVSKARAFAAAVDGMTLPDGRTVQARAVAGTDSATARAAALALLETAGPDRLVLVSSARCLTQGVDIPAVDGVLFADPKNSDVDIVQSVGRALRKAPGKRVGHILIPICIPAGLDDDTALTSSSFGAAWRILRGLRAMDPRLADELDALTFRTGRPRGSAEQAPRLRFHTPSYTDIPALLARLAGRSATTWGQMADELDTYVTLHGHAQPPRNTRLGDWCRRQRIAHHRGLLRPEQENRLQAVPGWAWDTAEQRWLEQYRQVAKLAAKNELDLHSDGVADLPLHAPDASVVRTVGRWCAQQRMCRRRGELSQRRQHKLDEIPGWSWECADEFDAACVDLLREYVAWKHDANPPGDCVEDDLPLGAWLNRIRRRRATENLSRPLLDEITVACAGTSTSGALLWYRDEVLWRLGLEALRQFVAREDHCHLPEAHVEILPDHTMQLSKWSQRQRRLYRAEKLVPHRIRLLEATTGWRWDTRAPRVALELADIRHGTRSAYVKGCHCDPCTDANRREQQARADLVAAGAPTTDLVDATPAREWLRTLRGQGAPVKMLARASTMSHSGFQKLISGKSKRILPSTEIAILGLTLENVREQTAPGSLVAAAPTWQLLDAMIARQWPKAWIARELGLGRSLQFPRDTITAASAAKVAVLAERLGTRAAPPGRQRLPLPRLDDLLAGEAAAEPGRS